MHNFFLKTFNIKYYILMIYGRVQGIYSSKLIFKDKHDILFFKGISYISGFKSYSSPQFSIIIINKINKIKEYTQLGEFSWKYKKKKIMHIWVFFTSILLNK